MKYYAIKLNFQAQREGGEWVKGTKLVSNGMQSNSKKNVFSQTWWLKLGKVKSMKKYKKNATL